MGGRKFMTKKTIRNLNSLHCGQTDFYSSQMSCSAVFKRIQPSSGNGIVWVKWSQSLLTPHSSEESMVKVRHEGVDVDEGGGGEGIGGDGCPVNEIGGGLDDMGERGFAVEGELERAVAQSFDIGDGGRCGWCVGEFKAPARDDSACGIGLIIDDVKGPSAVGTDAVVGEQIGGVNGWSRREEAVDFLIISRDIRT